MSTYDKAKKLIGPEKLEIKLNEIFARRSQEIMNYLLMKGIDASRIKISGSDKSVKLPYEEFSKNSINFKVDDE